MGEDDLGCSVQLRRISHSISEPLRPPSGNTEEIWGAREGGSSAHTTFENRKRIAATCSARRCGSSKFPGPLCCSLALNSYIINRGEAMRGSTITLEDYPV